MGCIYCKDTQENKLIYEGYEDKAEIVKFTNEDTYTLVVNGHIDIPINFCPLCGRKLSKVGVYKDE